MSFTDKVVIVTGASSGIGAATAKLFAQKKAHVAMIGRNAKKLENIAKDIKEKTDMEPLVIIADVSKEDEARGLVAKTVDHYGKLDILVNNAGITSTKSILSEDFIEDYDKIMAIDLRGIVVLTHAAIGNLIKTKGNIVNISSIASTLPSPGPIAYGTAKAGLDHFSKCVALDVAAKGVRVNVINPGPVKTDIPHNQGLTEEQIEFMYRIISQTAPLNRVSDSEEVAELILYLASDKARSITGVTYNIDCGVKLSGYIMPKIN